MTKGVPGLIGAHLWQRPLWPHLVSADGTLPCATPMRGIAPETRHYGWYRTQIILVTPPERPPGRRKPRRDAPAFETSMEAEVTARVLRSQRPSDLTRAGIELIDQSLRLYACRECGHRWIATVRSRGRLCRGWWRCPSGCNYGD